MSRTSFKRVLKRSQVEPLKDLLCDNLKPSMPARIGQKHPKGQYWPFDEERRLAVIARMEELGMSQSELSRRAVVSPAAIHDLLTKKATQTRVLPQILAALDMPMPMMENADQAVVAFVAILKSLTPSQQAQLLGMATEFVKLNEQLKK